jgi:hypothetical protein
MRARRKGCCTVVLPDKDERLVGIVRIPLDDSGEKTGAAVLARTIIADPEVATERSGRCTWPTVASKGHAESVGHCA